MLCGKCEKLREGGGEGRGGGESHRVLKVMIISRIPNQPKPVPRLRNIETFAG